MSRVLVLGGGFAGVVAAESLAKRLGPEHEITLVSYRREFTFFPALVRLAFGQCEVGDVFFDLKSAMLSRRIRFVQAEILSVNPRERHVLISNGTGERTMEYDYLVFALGRRLATECVIGFAAFAHHLLTVGASLKFGEAVKNFHAGHAVIGYCQDARLTVPVYETAFALDRALRKRGERAGVRITVVSPEKLGAQVGGAEVVPALLAALNEHEIEFRPDFPIDRITQDVVSTSKAQRLGYDLLMLIPPFEGPRQTMYTGLANSEGYVRVDLRMKATGADRIYAAGDCTGFLGPKMGHMAVLQAKVAAANLASEIEGHELNARYDHELMLVIDEGGKDSIYVHKGLWEPGKARIGRNRFWGWAKRVQKTYWQETHS